MSNSSAFARTQVYLTQAQQARLQAAARHAAVTKSELIRQAVDQFLDSQPAASADDQAQRLHHIVGMWADRSDMADPAAYVKSLRAPVMVQFEVGAVTN